MSVLRAIESKIEGLFEGVFGRAFRTHVQPVELARKLAKEMDEHRSVSVSRVYVPNEYTLYLSPSDRPQFAAYEGSLVGELQEYLAEHARREGYALLTPPRVILETRRRPRDGRVRDRDARDAARRGSVSPWRAPSAGCGRAGSGPHVPVAEAPAATMVYRPEVPLAADDGPPEEVVREQVTLTVDGRTFPLTSGRVVVGRSRECDIRVDDGNVSRRHFELVQEGPTAWAVADLGSTNGTEVNGRRVSGRKRLDDGDRISAGGTELVFGRSLR